MRGPSPIGVVSSTWKTLLQLPWNSMLSPILLVLLELENSPSKAMRMEQASVCCRGEQYKHVRNIPLH